LETVWTYSQRKR